MNCCIVQAPCANRLGRRPTLCGDLWGAQLEAFLGHWRAHLRPAHGLVFSQLNGAPLTVQGVHKLFYSSAFRITGKKTNPHLVRDMVVTYLRCAAFPLPGCPPTERVPATAKMAGLPAGGCCAVVHHPQQQSWRQATEAQWPILRGRQPCTELQ